MPGVQKNTLAPPDRAHVHARERRRMLLDLKTSRRHATNGLFGVQNANGSSCSSPNVVRLRGQAQKTEYFNDILSVKVAPVMLKLAQRDHALAAHRLADHRKGILPDLAVRCDVVRAVEISLVTTPPSSAASAAALAQRRRKSPKRNRRRRRPPQPTAAVARGLARAREGSDIVKPMVLMPVSAPINVLV